MAQDKIGLERLVDDAEGHEQFWIVFIDGDRVGQQGYVRSTGAIMSEEQVRAYFKKNGQPDHEVEAMFASARANYKQ